VTSTLAVGAYAIEAMQAKKGRTAAEEAFLQRWLRMVDENLSQFAKLRQAGVTFVAGTDAGWRFTPFDGLPTEMQLMYRAGMPTADVVAAGTGLAAKVIGIGDKVGKLAEGLAADVIVVQGNPLDDLEALRALRLVMQGGEIRSDPKPAVAR
jgi:imidazolonepropionase-like amidohydrolase